MAQRQLAEDLTSARVIIGVDPHTASHTAAALGTRREVLAHLRIRSDRAGYRQLRRWSARWPQRLWAVENIAGLGSSSTQWLLSDGEQVVDVPAKLSARVRLLSRGHGRTTDQADAVSTALAAGMPAPSGPTRCGAVPSVLTAPPPRGRRVLPFGTHPSLCTAEPVRRGFPRPEAARGGRPRG